VDIRYFDPQAVEPMDLGPEAIVFTGTMDYRPNVEGVCWFVREVWSEVRRTHPEATFFIVGRDPAPAVLKLAQTDGVTVTGSVSDVRPYLAGARLAVCPLLTARGIQNKILEAMAMALPVIATPSAAEGIDATASQGLETVNTPDSWAASIHSLVSREAECANPRCFVEQSYSWPVRQEQLLEAICCLTGKENSSRVAII
jgi:glycosyltransferase involved in cell wall biosynthesis